MGRRSCPGYTTVSTRSLASTFLDDHSHRTRVSSPAQLSSCGGRLAAVCSRSERTHSATGIGRAIGCRPPSLRRGTDNRRRRAPLSHLGVCVCVFMRAGVRACRAPDPSLCRFVNLDKLYEFALVWFKCLVPSAECDKSVSRVAAFSVHGSWI